MSCEFGNRLKISIFGESHSQQIGVRISGLPSGFVPDEKALAAFMSTRAPGNSPLTTARHEPDKVLLSCENGIFTAVINNTDRHSSDYSELYKKPRPSHADYPAYMKYGDSFDISGGGKYSGRMTAPLCAAGALCLQYLRSDGIDIGAHLSLCAGIADIPFDALNDDLPALHRAEGKDMPFLDDKAGAKAAEKLLKLKSLGDSAGGQVECKVTGLQPGIGDHMFGGLENRISACVFGIPAVKAVEFGAGTLFAGMTGSTCNDEFYYDDGKVKTFTNNCGGILGGMSSGMPLIFRCTFKPTPSIAKTQRTVDLKTGKNTEITIKGRHDPCAAIRAVPCVISAAAIALADVILSEKGENND